MKPLTPYIGGKARQAKWISEYVKTIDHETYGEPFCGSSAVYWHKPSSKLDILNDKDKRFSLMFKALRDKPDEVIEYLNKIEYSKASFDESYNHLRSDDLEEWQLGCWALYQVFASFSGYPDAHSFAWRKIGQNPAIKWQTRINNLGPYIEKIKNATILCYDGIEFIKKMDKHGVLLYVDPPYKGAEKRYKVSKGFSHEELAKTLSSLKHAKVILSHYYTEPYKTYFEDWEISTQQSVQSCKGGTIHSPQDSKKVVEALFIKRK